MKRLARFLFVLLPISAIFVLVASTQSGKAANPATFSFIDVGQDDSALLSDGNNYNVLIDGAQPAAGADALYPDRHVDGAYARSY